MLYTNITHFIFTIEEMNMYFNNSSIIEPKLPEFPITQESSEIIFENVIFVMLTIITSLISIILYFVVTQEIDYVCNCCKNSKCTVNNDLEI